jgi:uncharacterized protein YjbI with pentapeptide repeats
MKRKNYMKNTLYYFWQQKIKPYRIIINIIIFISIVLFIVASYLFHWNWTGLDGGSNIITLMTPVKGGTSTSEQQPAKTLWDWLQLLIIPLMLAIGGFWFNQIQKNRDEQIAEKRDQTERDIASDNQKEDALQAYIDKISELLLDHDLRNSKPDDEIQKIARVRTLTVLRRLDAERKGNIIQFLSEAGLIGKGEYGPIIDLGDADLSNVNLNGATLHDADLCYTNLSNANFSNAFIPGLFVANANLCGANFNNAYLDGSSFREANLSNANFKGANLNNVIFTKSNVITDQLETAKSLKGTTKPDGSNYPS